MELSDCIQFVVAKENRHPYMHVICRLLQAIVEWLYTAIVLL